MPKSNGSWYALDRDPAPMNKVLAFRDLHGNEWLGMNRLTDCEGRKAFEWSFIR
jgi:hypothetical protein